TFNDLSLNNPGTGYTLAATENGLTGATSSSFNVIDPFIVTNTNDSGPGSLRYAITSANSTSGAQTITFNIPGASPFVIAPLTPLPAVTDTTTIDGTTQPGFSGVPVVEIDGINLTGIVAGLTIGAPNSTVKGLCIIRVANSQFSRGISISTTANGNNVSGN